MSQSRARPRAKTTPRTQRLERGQSKGAQRLPGVEWTEAPVEQALGELEPAEGSP